MKLRLRSMESKQTVRIEVPDQSTLEHLKQTLLQTLDSSFSAHSLHLSLNRKDELQGSSPEDSLRSIGITSGDLVFFAFNPSEFSSQGTGTTSIESSQGHHLPDAYSQGSSSSQIQGTDSDIKKPRLENFESESLDVETITGSIVEEGEDDLESDCEEMDIEEEQIDVVGNKCSRPIFLRRVIKEELGYDRNAHKLLVTAVHAVLLESGFVRIDPVLGSAINNFPMPKDWPSPSFSMSLWYSVPELLGEGGKISINTELVVLKFQSLGHFVNVYGSLSCRRSSSVYRVSLDDRKFAPYLDLVWMDSVSSQINDEHEGKNTEKQVFEFWKVVKDALALPLLIDLCEETGLPLPASFMLLPAELKLKILETLSGVDIGRVECVCTELRYLASSNELWKMKFDQEFGFAKDAVTENKLWKAKFVASYAKAKLSERTIINMRSLRRTGRRDRFPFPFPVRHVIGGGHGAFGLHGQGLGQVPRRHNFIPHNLIGRRVLD